jgi:hypothetical protein
MRSSASAQRYSAKCRRLSPAAQLAVEVAADQLVRRYANLAGFDHRAAENHRTAHEPTAHDSTEEPHSIS